APHDGMGPPAVEFVVLIIGSPSNRGAAIVPRDRPVGDGAAPFPRPGAGAPMNPEDSGPPVSEGSSSPINVAIPAASDTATGGPAHGKAAVDALAGQTSLGGIPAGQVRAAIVADEAKGVPMGERSTLGSDRGSTDGVPIGPDWLSGGVRWLAARPGVVERE